jgi:hypothetical protein
MPYDTRADKYRRDDDLLFVPIYDGKYIIIQRAEGHMEFLRHAEPWEAANTSDWKHAGMILAAAQEIAALREELAKTKDQISRYVYPDDTGR